MSTDNDDRLNSLGFLTGRLHALIKKRVQLYLDQASVPLKMENYPAMQLLMREENVTQQAIADQIGYDRHRTSRMLDDLEQAGLISRINPPDNRREKHVVLTDLGRQSLETIRQAVTGATNDAIGNLPVALSRAVIQALQTMSRNLNG